MQLWLILVKLGAKYEYAMEQTGPGDQLES